MSDILAEGEINALLDFIDKSEHGGNWRRKLSKDDPRYDPNAPFDHDIEDSKDKSNRAMKAFFANGERDRILHEWAKYCQECIYCEELSPEQYMCKKLAICMSRDEVRKKAKRTDCPLGFDRLGFVELRKKEIEQEELQYRQRQIEHGLMQLYNDRGVEVFNSTIKSVRDRIRRIEKRVRKALLKNNCCQTKMDK